VLQRLGAALHRVCETPERIEGPRTVGLLVRCWTPAPHAENIRANLKTNECAVRIARIPVERQAPGCG
jgi:hypothetical protein